jgi:hypothetical protein
MEPSMSVATSKFSRATWAASRISAVGRLPFLGTRIEPDERAYPCRVCAPPVLVEPACVSEAPRVIRRVVANRGEQRHFVIHRSVPRTGAGFGAGYRNALCPSEDSRDRSGVLDWSNSTY